MEIKCHFTEMSLIETMLDTIKHLPTRGNPWSCKDFSIYVLDNYSVHMHDEVRAAFLSKGYIPIIM